MINISSIKSMALNFSLNGTKLWTIQHIPNFENSYSKKYLRKLQNSLKNSKNKKILRMLVNTSPGLKGNQK